MEHEFPFGIFRPELTGLPFQMFPYSRTFSAGMTQKVLFHLLFNRNSVASTNLVKILPTAKMAGELGIVVAFYYY